MQRLHLLRAKTRPTRRICAGLSGREYILLDTPHTYAQRCAFSIERIEHAAGTLLLETHQCLLDVQGALGRAHDIAPDRNKRGPRLAVGRDCPPAESRVWLADLHRIHQPRSHRPLQTVTGCRPHKAALPQICKIALQRGGRGLTRLRVLRLQRRYGMTAQQARMVADLFFGGASRG